MGSGWLKYRYLILSGFVFILMTVSISRQYWVGDFWEHSAAINEIAYNPLHPRHSLLAVDAPHALFSPYAVFWGLFSRFTHIGPIKTLSIAGEINLILFLAGLYFFISALWPKQRVGVAFYSLLLILLFWGAAVWNFSGFFHLRVFGYVLPYPSTFNLGLAFIILAINQKRIQGNKPILWAVILPLSLIVLLSHQFTFLFLAAGIVAMGICKREGIRGELLQIAGFFSLLILLACLWPYYPFLKLALGGASVYNDTQRTMYQYLHLRLWPALLGIPLLIIDLRANWRQPHIIMFGILTAVYLAAFASAAYSYGRVISFMVMIIDFTIARYLVQLEGKPPKFIKVANWPVVLSVGVTTILVALSFSAFISPALGRSFTAEQKSYEPYYFLLSHTNHYDVILANPGSSKSIPVTSFSGKLVGLYNDLPFIPDLGARVADAARFFDVDTAQDEREEIIQKYGVNFVLLENVQTAEGKNLAAALKTLGKAVYRNNRFTLIAVGQDRNTLP